MSGYQDYAGLDMDGENLLTELERNTVKLTGDQFITGHKTFADVDIIDLSFENVTSLNIENGIISQLDGNTGDTLDYGQYATYNDGSEKYRGIINKKATDKFYVFNAQTNKPVLNLDLNSQNLGTLIVREPVADNEVATKAYVESHGGGGVFAPFRGVNAGCFEYE
jgi:hypothetical protein